MEPIPGTSIALCSDCRANVGTEAHAQQFRYEVDGRVLTAVPRQRKKPKKAKAAKPTDEAKENRRLLDRAKQRAMWRLTRIYRPMYEVLLAEEKVRLGLDPTSSQGRPRPRAIADELLRDIEDAAERDERRGSGLRAEA